MTPYPIDDTNPKTFIKDGKRHTWYLKDPIPRDVIVQVRIVAIPKWEAAELSFRGCMSTPIQEIIMKVYPNNPLNRILDCLIKVDWTRRIFYKIQPVEYKQLSAGIWGYYK